MNLAQDDIDDDDLVDAELASPSSPSPPEHAALPPQRHPTTTGFFSTVFGRKRARNSDASEKALQQRKRIVSDFTAETILTSEFQPMDSLNSSNNNNNNNNNCSSHGVPVQTIIEGGCESSEHVEPDDLDDDDEDSPGSHTTNDNNNPLDQNESSA
jgi:hypothetical protein